MSATGDRLVRQASEYLESLLRPIVARSDELYVDATAQLDRVVLEVRSNYQDKAFLIGRAGRTIDAAITLMSAWAGRHGLRVTIAPIQRDHHTTGTSDVRTSAG